MSSLSHSYKVLKIDQQTNKSCFKGTVEWIGGAKFW